MLWPLVERPDFLESSETLRDAIRFLAAAWASRSSEARIRFETMALDGTRFEDEEDRLRWRRILGRVLNPIPEEQLELAELRAQRQELAAEGLLTENDPVRRLTTSWGERPDFVREQLRRDGVDVDDGPTRQILEASEALGALLSATPSESPALELAALWEAGHHASKPLSELSRRPTRDRVRHAEPQQLEELGQGAEGARSQHRTIDAPNVRKDAPAPVELLTEKSGSYADRIKEILRAHGVPERL